MRIDWIAMIFVMAWALPIWIAGFILIYGRLKTILVNVPFLIGPVQLTALFFLYCYARIAV